MPKFERTAGLMIDIQERLIPVLADHTQFVRNSTILAQGLNILGVPQIVTEQYPRGLGHTLGSLADVLNGVPIFEKTRFSAYTDEVQQHLQTLNAQTVIVYGCETHVCVLQTVLDLHQQNFSVVVAEDAVASRTPANKQNALAQMRDGGAIISNVESLLFMLMQDAKHPQFKAISQLIK